MRRWSQETGIAAFVGLLLFVISSGAATATQVAGAPPPALQSAIRSFITINPNDTITWDNYSQVSLCPAGRVCVVDAYAYLIGYRIGDGAGTAVAYGHDTQTCASCWTYTVLYAAGGPMDVPTLQSVGIDPTTAQALLAH